MLLIDHPIKRDDLLKDIPDNKAFYPCVGARAKSHLKWAEAFWLLLGSKSNREDPPFLQKKEAVFSDNLFKIMIRKTN